MKTIRDYIISDGFCENCAGLKYVRNYLDESGYDECMVCSGDISNPKCLKRSAYERICAAVDEINQAIGEQGSFSHDN